jgi:hypothetical protein
LQVSALHMDPAGHSNKNSQPVPPTGKVMVQVFEMELQELGLTQKVDEAAQLLPNWTGVLQKLALHSPDTQLLFELPHPLPPNGTLQVVPSHTDPAIQTLPFTEQSVPPTGKVKVQMRVSELQKFGLTQKVVYGLKQLPPSGTETGTLQVSVNKSHTPGATQ